MCGNDNTRKKTQVYKLTNIVWYFFCLFWLRDLLTDRVLKPVPSSVPKPPNTPVQPPALVNVPTHPYDRQYYSQAHRG